MLNKKLKKNSHLKPRWMVERDEWRRRRPIENPNILEVPPTQSSQTQRALRIATASDSYQTACQTAHQNPASLNDPVVNAASFIGPGLSSADRYATSNSIQAMWFNEALRRKSWRYMEWLNATPQLLL